MKTTAVIGFYGKLPMQTDMLSGNLPVEFITPWHNWLQTALAASREDLGWSWLNSYLTTPIWRFVLSAGLCGDSAWAGILMPSVDKAGHYFPLTVVAPFAQSQSLPCLFTLGNDWFEQLEAAALSGLEDNIDLAQFTALLKAIPVFPLIDNQFYVHDCAGKKSLHINMSNLNLVSEAFVELNACLLDSFLPAYSLWGTGGSEQVLPVLSIYEGLPLAHRFATFLSNNISEPKKTNWLSWAATDTGKRRKHNEDALLNKPELRLWAVADGMGGHKAGDVASQLIVSALSHATATAPLATRIEAVKQCLQQVNNELQQFARREYGLHIVGSTVVVLICEAQRCAVLWAGDSRLYRLRQQTLQQLTQDHSAHKEFSNSSVITKAVGATDTLELDCEFFDIQTGDLFLLSSDGLDKEISFAEIEHIMKTYPHEDIANVLINRTLECGARDNVSVIVICDG